MFERSDLFDPQLAAALGRKAVESPSSPHPQRGGHASRLRGTSLEFAEHTVYSPGDDLKGLDWKVFAKTDRYYVRRFEDERLARALLVLDASNSMAYGGNGENLLGSKFQLACRISTALASALLRQGDAVGLMVCGPDPVYLTPRPGTAQLEALLDVLTAVKVGGGEGVGSFFTEATQKLGRHSSLFVLSDLLAVDDESLSFLAGQAQREIAVRILQVLSPDELDLPFDKPLKFIDLESAAELNLDPEGIRKAYREEMRHFVEGVKARAVEYGAGWALVTDAAEAGMLLPPLLAGPLGRGDAIWTG